MKTHLIFFATLFIFFVGFSSAGRVDISLTPADWVDHGTVTSARALSQTAEGYLRATCNSYRGHVNYRTKDTYNFQGAVVRYKWRVNCGGQYSWTQDGCYPWGRMAAQNLSTSHSWASSIVISTNVWIYTEVQFNPNRTWSINYSYNGYGLGGINTNSGTITDANWELLATSFVHKLVGDGYANSFYYEIAELYYETPGPDTIIANPADGAAFSPGASISFEATASGGAEPYGFAWESDVDGALGEGQSLALDTLSEGVHTITVTCTDDTGETASKSITIYILNPPVIEPVAHHTITDGGSYNGPVPVLTQGNTAVTWSLAEGPAGMTINAATGQVLWAAPVTTGSPYTVTIRAENPKGSDQVSWQLEVIGAPSFATPLWSDIKDGFGGNTGHDHFNRTAIDLEGNVLVAGYIDSVAGHATAAYLAKYSGEGQLLWSKTIDAPSSSGKAEFNDRFYDVAVDSENNVIVVGAKSGNYNAGNYHTAWWVQKYSPDGQTLLWEILWQDTYSSAWQTALGVHIDGQDNVYVAGTSFGSWGTSGAQNQWVIYKYNKNGQVLLGPIKVNFVNFHYLPEYAYDITVDANGDFYAVGMRGVSGADGGITNNLDWHVRKFNGTTGATLWQDTYSGPANLLDYALGAVLDSQGNLLVTGFTNKGTDNSTNINYDWLMIKYDGATGTRLWTQTYESRPGASEVCYKAVVDENDDLYVCGYIVNPAGILQRRIARISGIDGATLAEKVWQSDYNGNLTGLDRKGDLLAVSGSLANALNNDGFVSLLTLSVGVRIVSPAYHDWFEFSAPITFSAELAGAAEPPYYYRWSSDIDGDLGTGHTLEISGLSPGEHLITCRLDYGDGQTMQSSVRIIVAVPPQITPPDDAIIGEGQAYTSPAPVLNEAAHSAVWALIDAPEGMTINSQTGSVSWPSPVGAPEPYTITIQAQNPFGSDQAAWQLTVLSLPQIETPPTQIAVESEPFTSEAPTLVKGTPPIEWSLVSGPAQMTIDPATGEVSWENPVPSFSAHSVTIRAANAIGSHTATFSIWVHSVPQIAVIADRNSIAGADFSFTPVLTKGVPAVTWTLDEAPPEMTINADTGALHWPNAQPAGTVRTVTVRAANTLGSDTQSFTISLMIPPMVAAPDDETIHEAQPYTRQIQLVQGSLPVTFSLVTAPVGMSIDAAAGQLSWPNPVGATSPYTITVRAANVVGFDQKSYALTVLQRPVVQPIAAALIAEGLPYTAAGQLSRGSAPITWELTAAPAQMTVDAQSGVVSWPSPVFAGSPHSATLTAQNVVGSDSQSWQITVVQPPIIAPYGDRTAGNAAAYTAPLPTLTQGTHTTWSLEQAPAGMTINASTGQMHWPAPIASETPYTVTFRAENIAGNDTETFHLTIQAKPVLAPIATLEIPENIAYVGPAAQLLAGQPPVTFSLTQAPAGMTVDPATGAINWPNPLPSFSAYPVTLRATNAIGLDTASFSVWVHSVPQIAAITDRQIILDQPFYLNPVLVKGVPAVEWLLDAAPPQMTINAATGAISWPAPGPEDSTHTVTVRAANAMGSHTQSFTINVMLPPILADLDNQTTHEGQSYIRQVVLSQGSKPVQYTLITGPVGMTIDTNGQLTLPYANGNFSPYTVTVRAINAVGSDQKTFVLTVLQAPLIRPIAAALTAENAPYAAAAPGLYQGSAPIVWSLITAPAGMTIDPATGAVNWPSAAYAGSPHTIMLKAENVVGTHTQSWPITVVQTPVIAAYGDKLAGNATTYIAPLPTLTQGSHVTWSLQQAPAGMNIHSSSGQIVWPSPAASDVPHIVTLQAQNIAGSDTETFALTIHSKPALADAADVQMVENRPYAGPAAQLLAGQAPVTFALTQAPTGMTIDADTGAISWAVPTAVGSPHTVRLRASNIYGTDEKTFKAVVPIGYAAEAWTDIELAPAGSPIPIVGQAYDLTDGTPAADAAVHLHIRLKNTVRIYKPMTDTEGRFAFTFTPVGNEAGLYGISAGHPLDVPQEAQDNFTLVALTASDSVRRPNLTEGEWYVTTVSLKNPGDTMLTQIEAVKVGGAETIEIDFEPLAAIAGGATETAALRLRAVDASVKLSVVDVQFVSDQGATASLAYTTRVIPLTVDVKVLPATLEAGMVRGQQQAVSFEVANEGGLATPELSVLIPGAPWLTMATPVVIGVLEPGDVRVVTLLLTPDESLPLGPYQGSLYVHGTGMTRTVPFTFNCVSDRVGRLDVRAVDEFTYYAQGAPLVGGARLTLRNAFTNAALFVNEPMPDGRWLLDDIAEGYYILELAAPEHSGYRSTIYAAPGVTTTITAFMSRELVKYTWTVTPTAIQDVYTVTLNTTFETNVPAPVVVVEPANVDLSAMVDGRMQVDFTVTNHGLIAAEDVHLVFDDHPRYQVELLTDFNGQVGPGLTVVIPAVITDKSMQPMSLSDIRPLDNNTLMPFGGNCDPVRGGTYYTYVCGPDRKWKKVPIRMANWACDLVNVIRGIVGPGDGGYNPERDYEDDYTPKTQWPGSGGGGGGLAISFAPNAPRAPRFIGDSPDVPLIAMPRINLGGDIGNTCDPCPQNIIFAIWDCVSGSIPVLSTILKALSFYDNCFSEEMTFWTCLNVYAEELIDFVPIIGDAYSKAKCIDGLLNACNTSDPAAYRMAAAEFQMLTGLDMPADPPVSSDMLALLVEQRDRMLAVADAMNYALGDPIWFEGHPDDEPLLEGFFAAFSAAIEGGGEEGVLISASEQAALLTMPLPGHIVPDDVVTLCQRWNRTQSYWQTGKFQTTDLEPGDDPDFIATDIAMAKNIAAQEAIAEDMAMGYTHLYEALEETLDMLKDELESQAKGVCVQVQMQIQQTATLTRTGFTAQLQMQNTSGIDAIDNIAVEVSVMDANGNDATALFGIYPPHVTGVSDVAGGGRLDPGKAFDAQWLLVPTLDAAPQEATYYYVGGTIRYTINGGAVTIPILPDTITVWPDAELHLRYFLERDVYGDDPFTDEIEPSVPFVLGLMVSNEGYGSAYNMTIHSAQPTIVRQEADKQILLDFELLDAQVDDEPRTPSLRVALGHIAPARTKTVVWRMQSSLQGQFVNYEAEFAHTNTLGDPRLSLIQSISIHEMVRAVLADRPGDDTVPDFLTNDIPDADGLPDTLHLSDGTIEPVSAFAGSPAWLGGTPESGQVTLILPQTPTGFFYVRLNNPGWPDYVLTQAVRSDGKVLPGENAWTTHKRHYPEGQPDYDEALLHLFDFEGSGSYTLYFELPANQPPVVNAISVSDATELSSEPLALTVTYRDQTGINAATLGDGNIIVIGPDAQPLVVQYIQIAAVNGQDTTVLYHILPPNGLWEGSLNGLYSVALADNQVADSEGLFAEGAVLSGFVVSINECVSVEFNHAVLVGQRRISRTEYEMDYRVVVQNRCDKPIRNLRLIPKSTPANLDVAAHDVRFCHIPALGQSTSSGLLTVRIDYDNPPVPSDDITWQRVVFHPADVTMNGTVNVADLAAFAAAWLTDDPCFDWAPLPDGDGHVDLLDFVILAEHWMNTP